MRKFELNILVFLALLLLVGCGSIATDDVVASPQPAETSLESGADLSAATFSETVQPLLVTYCSACHNTGSPTGGLDATTYSGLVLETDAVISEDPDASELIQFLEGGIMPPPGNPSPSEEEIAAIRAWVLAGALDN